jgi:hypothetical protein
MGPRRWRRAGAPDRPRNGPGRGSAGPGLTGRRTRRRGCTWPPSLPVYRFLSFIYIQGSRDARRAPRDLHCASRRELRKAWTGLERAFLYMNASFIYRQAPRAALEGSSLYTILSFSHQDDPFVYRFPGSLYRKRPRTPRKPMDRSRQDTKFRAEGSRRPFYGPSLYINGNFVYRNASRSVLQACLVYNFRRLIYRNHPRSLRSHCCFFFRFFALPFRFGRGGGAVRRRSQSRAPVVPAQVSWERMR